MSHCPNSLCTQHTLGSCWQDELVSSSGVIANTAVVMQVYKCGTRISPSGRCAQPTLGPSQSLERLLHKHRCLDVLLSATLVTPMTQLLLTLYF